MQDPRKDAPSYHRNIEPIVAKLRGMLSTQASKVLEIGSGSGQHVTRFANEFPAITFQPTEYDVENLASINAWAMEKPNILPAQQLDVMSDTWLDEKQFDALLCFNVIHITPWEVTEAIFKGAAKHTCDASQVILYGPYRVDGKQTSKSNVQFEVWLKERDARFGVRDIDDVKKVAALHGFTLKGSHEMPANNFIQVFARG